jgi:menaquinone-9 beta-reductase
MSKEPPYDLAVVGGGLAGLSLSILQAKAGKKVILFEKNDYPSHKVCGEYISLESWKFLENLGLNLAALDLPIIKNLTVSSPKGTTLNTPLDLGGFGISRYTLDSKLADLAVKTGVFLRAKTQVNQIVKEGSHYVLETENGSYSATNAVGTFGKRSNLDVVWNRTFLQKNRESLNQYIGVKYHIKCDFPKDKIALHNFKDGYCGISAIENGTYCLCYLTTKKNLKAAGNSIQNMEKTILSQNPYLAHIFKHADFLFKTPEVISQISFEKKPLFYNDIPLAGDTAGVIAPLCGNGMSMAMHAAYLLHKDLQENKNTYQSTWNAHFKTRLYIGRLIQSLFGGIYTTEAVIRLLRLFPKTLKKLINLTHGQSFG